MPYAVVKMYVAQMAAIKAEEKLDRVSVIMVANAEKRTDRERVLNEWRRTAGKGEAVKKENLNGVPTGMGVK